jgi:hypothetical protein
MITYHFLRRFIKLNIKIKRFKDDFSRFENFKKKNQKWRRRQFR